MEAALPSETLRARLRALRRTLDADLETVATLRAVAARSDEWERLSADLDHQMQRVGGAAVVVLAGATGAGKSSLLNALVGRPVAAEGVDRPTTTQPVIYAPADADLSDLLAALDDPSAARVVRHEASDANPWTAQVLVDAPDVNSIAGLHRATVRTLAEHADVLLVVLHRQSVTEAASVSFLDEFAGRRRMLFALNRADELTPTARRELAGQAARLAAERFEAAGARVVVVSAKEAQTQPRAEGWPELCRSLAGLVQEGAVTGVRRRNAAGTVARLAAVFRGVREETTEDFQALPGETAASLAALADGVASEVADRLALRRADLSATLCRETAKRWEGPGGWALRTSGLAGLGLGAGVLVARRHPLLAAGAAAGGVAADQVERLARARRIGREDGLLPEPGDFGRAWNDALAGPLIRAGRLTGEPAAFCLPGPDEARAQAAAAVGEAWDRLLARELPAAAEGSALRHFRLLLDLPVYALAGFVVWKAGTGLFHGDYAGLDLLANASVLLLAWLLAVRLGVRRGLAVRARQLLAGATRSAGAALERWSAQAAQATEAAVQKRWEALERLASLEEPWRERLGAS